MQLFCLFEWSVDLEPLYKGLFEDVHRYFSKDNVYVLTINGNAKFLSKEDELRKAFDVTDKPVSIEIYSCVKDKSDPESGWQSYLCCGQRPSGQRELIFATKDESMERENIIKLVEDLSKLGKLGYGFSFKTNSGLDGRYFARGLSTTDSTSLQRDVDSRWFNERLIFKGEEPAAKRRHLNGHFKDVFDYNIINGSHVSSLRSLTLSPETIGEIEELFNDTYLWIPNRSNAKKVRDSIVNNGLLI